MGRRTLIKTHQGVVVSIRLSIYVASLPVRLLEYSFSSTIEPDRSSFSEPSRSRGIGERCFQQGGSLEMLRGGYFQSVSGGVEKSLLFASSNEFLQFCLLIR